MDVDDPKVYLEGQGQGHEVQKRYFRSHSTTLQVLFEVNGHIGQGQRSHGSRSKVDLVGQVKCQGHQVKNVILGLI